MKGLIFLLAILINHSEGAMDIVFTNNPATVGVAVTITCTKSSPLVGSVSWFNDRYTTAVISNCRHKSDLCTPSQSTLDDRYYFTSDIENKEFTMIITKVEQADKGVYRCKDLKEEGNATLQVVQPGKTEDGGLTGGTIAGIVLIVSVIVGLAVGFMCYTGKTEDGGLTVGEIAGIVVAAVVLFVGVGLVIGCLCYTGKTEDGGLTGGAIAGIVVAAVVLIVGVGLVIGFLCYTGYIPGRWSAKVRIPQKEYPHIKFKDVLSFAILEEIEEETGASIRDKNSVVFSLFGQDDNLLLCTNQPLEIYVTACFNIRVKRAVQKIEKIIKEAKSKAAIIILKSEEDEREEDVKAPDYNPNLFDQIIDNRDSDDGEEDVKAPDYNPNLLDQIIDHRDSDDGENFTEDCIYSADEVVKIIEEATNKHQGLALTPTSTGQLQFPLIDMSGLSQSKVQLDKSNMTTTVTFSNQVEDHLTESDLLNDENCLVFNGKYMYCKRYEAAPFTDQSNHK